MIMKKKILVTDDDPSLQDIFRIILEKAGYEVDVLSNGSDILHDHYEPPDLFLLDKQLSGVDGLDICKYLKSRKNTKDIPIIMVSATVGIGPTAKEAGADGFIEKPFDKKYLLEMVEEYIH
jgi:DNA-binding response OmpR family regulator